MSLQVGDRVKVYGNLSPGEHYARGQIGTVETIVDEEDEISVKFDDMVGKSTYSVVHPKQCRRLKATRGLKAGTKVKFNFFGVKTYREILAENYEIPGSGEFHDDDLAEMLMFAMADVYPPYGEIVSGKMTDGEYVYRVKIFNRFGSYDGYLDVKHLEVVE